MPPPLSSSTPFNAMGLSPAVSISGPDDAQDAVTLSGAWFAINDQVNRLTHQWQKLEAKMMSDLACVKLSREERRFFPAQIKLAEIDELKEGVQEQQHELLERLVLAPTNDLPGAVAKLSVVLGVMYPEDYPHCYELIEDVAKTLSVFKCHHCNQPLAKLETVGMVSDAMKTWARERVV